MYEFVICDDDNKTVEIVKNIINKNMKTTDYKYKIYSFNDYTNEFKKYVACNKKRVIYILDIEMPSESGIAMARYIRNIDKQSIIAILTSHHENADEIYKGRLNILTFISKFDKCEENIDDTIKTAITYFDSSEDVLKFSDLGNDYSIFCRDILYITKDGRKTLIKLSQYEYEVYTSLDKLKNNLPNYFVQSHRACIVNMNRVIKINRGKKEIHFDNGEVIDYIGDKYKKDLVIC